jgi:histidinol-phosphate aminotransferase
MAQQDGESMSRYWTELAGSLTPYVPGEQPQGSNLVKLNTNECPFPPSPKVQETLASFDAKRLRFYPDPKSDALRQSIAQINGLQLEQVFVGNGSDEVLALAYLALLKHDLPLYFADVTYSFYPVWADLCGVHFEKVPLASDFRIDIEAYPERNGGIIIANPNAPTGILLDLESIRRLLQRSSGSVVVLDEAYIDFGGDSAVQLIDEFDNLLVVQTLSKSRSLAGLRVGMAMGNPDLIEALNRVKDSFNSYPLDTIAQQVALAALEDEAYFNDCCQSVIEGREIMASGLKELGFDVLPSSANFLFVTHPHRDAVELFGQLRERRIIVRHFTAPKIAQYLRISVGDEAQCEALMQALKGILAD